MEERTTEDPEGKPLLTECYSVAKNNVNMDTRKRSITMYLVVAIVDIYVYEAM
jgi:hypothetical protein